MTPRQRSAAWAHVLHPRRRKRAEVELTEAIRNATDLGLFIPCTNGGSWWISESAEDRAYAVELCQDCPIRRACRTAASATREPFGVWGGVDRTPAPTPATVDA